jgi:hypothetical protein
MGGQIPVTLLLAENEASITSYLMAQMQRAPFFGALVFTTAASVPPVPAAAVFSVPTLHWLALPSCLCCMSPTDPRLILLRALDTGVGEPRRPVDCIIFSVPASIGANAQRTLNSIAPLTDRLASLRSDRDSVIDIGNGFKQPVALQEPGGNLTPEDKVVEITRL